MTLTRTLWDSGPQTPGTMCSFQSSSNSVNNPLLIIILIWRSSGPYKSSSCQSLCKSHLDVGPNTSTVWNTQQDSKPWRSNDCSFSTCLAAFFLSVVWSWEIIRDCLDDEIKAAQRTINHLTVARNCVCAVKEERLRRDSYAILIRYFLLFKTGLSYLWSGVMIIETSIIL